MSSFFEDELIILLAAFYDLWFIELKAAYYWSIAADWAEKFFKFLNFFELVDGALNEIELGVLSWCCNWWPVCMTWPEGRSDKAALFILVSVNYCDPFWYINCLRSSLLGIIMGSPFLLNLVWLMIILFCIFIICCWLYYFRFFAGDYSVNDPLFSPWRKVLNCIFVGALSSIELSTFGCSYSYYIFWYTLLWSGLWMKLMSPATVEEPPLVAELLFMPPAWPWGTALLNILVWEEARNCWLLPRVFEPEESCVNSLLRYCSITCGCPYTCCNVFFVFMVLEVLLARFWYCISIICLLLLPVEVSGLYGILKDRAPSWLNPSILLFYGIN